ncbi:pH-response regulator protein palA/rim20 [Coemansia erecta]|nr:pH-response regulator protein palA/rim20 [Coemansia erecta]KAJ2887749.1 pH-response regulator protein palA/rim20 [Coemansia asiatica]
MYLFRQAPAPDKDGNSNSALLAVKFKTTEKTVFFKSLSDYIASSYAEPPEAYRDDLRVLDELRQAATSTLDINNNVLKRNIRYYGQLCFILSKFPADVGIKFTWFNAFNSEDSVTYQDMYYERACVLFNIGAIYSQLACKESRNDKDSLTKAFGYFQNAAGIFHLLQHKIVCECRSQLTTDLSSYMLTALENLMLSQAQECVWSRSVLSNMKDANVARVAAQVAELYDMTIEAGSQGSLANTIPQAWLDTFKVKKLYFSAEAQYRKAQDCLADCHYGEEVARMKLANDICGQINELVLSDQRWSKSIRVCIVDMAKQQMELVSSNCSRAVHDNDVIYLDPVPSVSTLAAIPPYKLAQSKTPEIVENPGKFLGDEELGPPLFKGLVPFVIHQAASLYEDRKEQLVTKDLIASLDELTADCESVLSSLNLPYALEAIQKPVGLPPSILVGADEIRSEGGLLGLKRLLDSAIGANKRANDVLDESEKTLLEEAQEDQRVRQNAPSGSERAKRPSSSELTNTLRSEMARFRNALHEASQKDALIKDVIDKWSSFLSLLSCSRDEIERQVPSTTVNPITDPNHSRIVERLHQYLGEVSIMKRERLKSIEKLKRIAAEDDVTPVLNEEMQRLAALSSTPILKYELHQFEDVFLQRLDKYTSWRKYISEEAEVQTELLDSIREANQAFIMARTNHPLLQQREQFLIGMETAIKRFREASFNLHDGLRFYATIESDLNKLKDNCMDFAMARHLNAKDLLGISHEEMNAVLAHSSGQPSGSQQQDPNAIWDPSMPLRYTKRN